MQTYADRDVTAVAEALRRTVDAFATSGERATYMLAACDIGGRKGLYGTDFFNRSAFRRKLERLGMQFSKDPFSTFRGDGCFESQDRAPFRAEFVTLGVPPAGRGVVRSSPAELLYQCIFYRIADVREGEMARLAAALEDAEGISGGNPKDLVAALLTP